MRIVIDMQGAQTESRFRGIGRYTLSFAQAVVRNRGEHEVFLALSGLFPHTIEPIRAAFEGLLPQENIRVWHAPGPVAERIPGNETRRDIAELLREAFLASLQPDVIHVPSLFEGFVDDAVTSVGLFDSTTPVSVTLHDLIPLLNPDQYLRSNLPYERYYTRKIEFLNRAAVYLAVSESSRHEGISGLGRNEDLFINTSEAVEPEFRPSVLSDADRQFLHQKHGIRSSFVLYTGGVDERKNLKRLIEAYAALSPGVRQNLQLVLAGHFGEDYRSRFTGWAESGGLKKSELIFTGYLSDDELIQLYADCKLFVFPSWHEGFGLPALEAMACGAVVIGANTSSLPEVIGHDAALFDPFRVEAITEKMQQALTNDGLRAELKAHGLKQAKQFSWDATAQRAIAAWTSLNRSGRSNLRVRESLVDDRARLIEAVAQRWQAHDDPGLVALASHLAQNQNAGVERQLFVDISELCQHDAATGVQRVVRSYLHQLLASPPTGFRVRPVYATQTEGYRHANRYLAQHGYQDAPIVDEPIQWQRGDLFFGLDMQHHVQLAQAPTYAAMSQAGIVVKFLVYDLLPIQLADFFKLNSMKELHERWLAMVAQTDEAICISKATADALDAWLADSAVKTKPGFRTAWVHIGADLEGSKPSGGLPANADATLRVLRSRTTFLAVSTLEPRKAQAQILDALDVMWAQGVDANLVLVGQQGWKVEELVERIQNHPELGKRLFWLKGISDEYLELVYQASTCLVAASLNEGFGLPLIEAARHGIPIVARDIPVFREVAGEAAHYFDGATGEQLADALHRWMNLQSQGKAPAPTGVRWLTWKQSTAHLKNALVQKHYARRQLLVDISELVQRDAKTGIQRVVRSILNEWLVRPPHGYAIEPVYATIDSPYRYARKFTARFMGTDAEGLVDDLMEYQPGDTFLALDLNHHVPRVHRSFLQAMYQHGVDVQFLMYDLLPVQFPQFWEPQHAVHLVVEEWMGVVATLGGVVCISKAVANEFEEWMASKNIERHRKFSVRWFHLGADVANSVASVGLPENADEILNKVACRPAFLMVGTLEPRKGHTQVLDAFEMLWQNGCNISLVIVGKPGWLTEALIERLNKHEQRGERLFWLAGISDEYLEKIYAASACLIAASYGEGFGLPLIEAAQHKLPILARDIPVFKEVADNHAYFFDGVTANDLVKSLSDWMVLYRAGNHPRSEAMPWLTWQQSARHLFERLVFESRTSNELPFER